jgi:tetratricopeptide (TPR) repeat protein
LKNEPDHAMADYNEAIRLNPKFSVAFNNQGTTFARKKDYARAIADYTEAFRLDPEHAEALFRRGIVRRLN